MTEYNKSPEFSQEKNAQPFFSPESHSFNVGIAQATKSVNAAIIFNHIFFWLKLNKSRGQNQIDGRTWMYDSVKSISEYFSYLSIQQVTDSLRILVKHGYLLQANHSENKMDRRNWYAMRDESWLDPQKMFALCSADQNDSFHGPSGSDLGTKCIYKDTDNRHTDNKEREEAPPPLPPPKPKKSAISEPKISFRENIYLTQKQYDQLLKDNSKEKVEWMFDKLDSVKASRGLKYKSDYHTMVKGGWVQKAYDESMKSGKIVRSSEPITSDNALKNKKICELVERKFEQRYTSKIFFQAGYQSAILVHEIKDIKKEYLYNDYETDRLKKILLKDLEMIFPGAREVLLPSENKISSIISNAARQMRVNG
jgi:hypothetical protein